MPRPYQSVTWGLVDPQIADKTNPLPQGAQGHSRPDLSMDSLCRIPDSV